MDLKEQVAREIFEYDFTGFNPKWAECANKSHWLNLANKIIELFEQANPIQAGEDGLVNIGVIGDICNFDIPKSPTEYEQQLKLMGICNKVAKAQKALDESRIKQINYTDTIEIFIDGKKTVFITESQAKQKQAETVNRIMKKVESILMLENHSYTIYADGMVEEHIPQNCPKCQLEAFKKQTLEEMNK